MVDVTYSVVATGVFEQWGHSVMVDVVVYTITVPLTEVVTGQTVV